MARAGAYYTYQDGQLITLRDLLERERGREVTDNEARNYCLRYRKLPSNKEKVEKFIKYIKSKRTGYALQ